MREFQQIENKINSLHCHVNLAYCISEAKKGLKNAALGLVTRFIPKSKELMKNWKSLIHSTWLRNLWKTHKVLPISWKPKFFRNKNTTFISVYIFPCVDATFWWQTTINLRLRQRWITKRGTKNKHDYSFNPSIFCGCVWFFAYSCSQDTHKFPSPRIAINCGEVKADLGMRYLPTSDRLLD